MGVAVGRCSLIPTKEPLLCDETTSVYSHAKCHTYSSQHWCMQNFFLNTYWKLLTSILEVICCNLSQDPSYCEASDCLS